MCQKNPTEDTEWCHESFETGELPLIPDVCNKSTLCKHIHHVLVVQQGNEVTHRGPVVLVNTCGAEVGRAIAQWERQTQAEDLLRSAGSVEPVIIQAITHTYDSANPSLWVPVDQRPDPCDDSVPEMQYANRRNCGYRSLHRKK